jgi:hypothetical protein
MTSIRQHFARCTPGVAALLLLAPYLLKRRRGAWQVAIGLMPVLGMLDLAPQGAAASSPGPLTSF